MTIDEARKKLKALSACTSRTNDIRIDVRETAHRSSIQGYAIVFNSRSVDLGGFQEIIRPEAVTRTLRDALDVRALVDHESAKVLGRVSAGTLKLRTDSRGLAVEIDPPDTTVARDVLELIRRRDISGMSFAFRMLKDEWRMDGDTPIREVLDMTVREVSVVTFPAYPATSVHYRTTAPRETELSRLQAQLDAAMGGRGMSLDWADKFHRTRLAMHG